MFRDYPARSTLGCAAGASCMINERLRTREGESEPSGGGQHPAGGQRTSPLAGEGVRVGGVVVLVSFHRVSLPLNLFYGHATSSIVDLFAEGNPKSSDLSRRALNHGSHLLYCYKSKFYVHLLFFSVH